MPTTTDTDLGRFLARELRRVLKARRAAWAAEVRRDTLAEVAAAGLLVRKATGGLVLEEVKPGVHRWVRPDTGEGHDAHPETGEPAGDAHARQRATGLAGRVKAKVDAFLVNHATTVHRIGKVAAVLDAVMTTPEDVLKWPWLAGKFGTNTTATGDQLGDTVGVPGHLAARVVAAAVAQAWKQLRAAAGAAKAETDDPTGVAAELVAGLVNAALEELGLPPVDAGEVRGWLDGTTKVVVKAAAHAPAGGVTIGGHEYRGGEFIPADVMAGATDEEKAKVGGKADDGGDPPKKTAGKRGARTAPPKLPPRFAIGAGGRALVDASVQRWAEGTNEPHVAKAVGGHALPDNEPMDVQIPPPPSPPAHGIELKTMVFNGHGQIHMSADAKRRKRAWQRKNGVPVHTVVVDDRDVYNAHGPGRHDLSKRKVYYRRGFGSFVVDRMHEVPGGFAGLKALLDTPTRKLPPGAWKPKPAAMVDRHGPPPAPAAAPAAPDSGADAAARATAADWVARSPIPEALRAKYVEDAAHVLSRMPAGCRRAAMEALAAGSVNFHESTAHVRAELERQTGRKEKGEVGGFVSHRRGDDRAHLHVDGGGSDPAGARGIYAHELGHAVDVGHRYSSDPKWQAAWKREVFNGKALLSRYARTSEAEGFAELHRHLVTHGVQATREKWPKCTAFLESKGLL